MKLHGRHGQIEFGTGSPAAVIGSLSAWTISGTRDKVDVTSFGDTNKTSLAGLKDASGTFDGFFDTAYIRELLDVANAEDGGFFKVTMSTDHPDFYVQGPCWLDVNLSGAVNDAVKVTGTFVANGAWIYQMDGSPVD